MLGGGVGSVPDELVDSQLCEIYGWTWQQLQETPIHVRHAFTVIQAAKAANAQSQSED